VAQPGDERYEGGATSFSAYRWAPSVVHDRGGLPSRFFYCAKASRSERNAGCEGMALRERDASKWAYLCNVCGCRFGHNGKPDCGHDDVSWVECRPTQNHHPTVKPLALMRWLVRLVAYPGDTVLDPFTGSGTTGVACAEEGREFVGIEREAEYVEIARRRIEAASAQERLPV
jgi:site-specific DNA-methyltransferase (adenine-specific)